MKILQDLNSPPNEAQIAYCAGFMDGEGCISLYLEKRSRRYRLQVMVGQGDPRPLQLLGKFFGGAINKSQKIYPTRRNPFWQWSVSGPSARAFLTSVLPYLIVKRDRAEQAIAFLQLQYLRREDGKAYTEQDIEKQHLAAIPLLRVK